MKGKIKKGKILPKKLRLDINKVFIISLLAVVLMLLLTISYLLGRSNISIPKETIDAFPPVIIDTTPSPTMEGINSQKNEVIVVTSTPNPITPNPTKIISKIPININSVIYYCNDDRANTISKLQSNITSLKKEYSKCWFNQQLAKNKCQDACTDAVHLCSANCVSGPVFEIDSCRNNCYSNAPTCSCPEDNSCQGINSNIEKDQNELNNLIRTYCP